MRTAAESRRGLYTPQRVRARSPQLRLKGPWEPSTFSSRSFLPELGHTRDRLLGRGSRVDSREAGEGLENAGLVLAGEETKSGHSGGQAPYF